MQVTGTTSPTTIEEGARDKSITTTNTQITEKPASEDRRPSVEDKIKEDEAERISSAALTEAAHEILATPLTFHLPSVEHPDEKPSVDSLTQIAEQIKSIIPSPVTRTEKEMIETTDTKEELIPETTTLSTKETVQESTSEDRPSLVDHATKEIEAERLSTQALTEAMREMLATPLTVHLPSVDSTTETTTTHTEEQLEKQSVEIPTPRVEQITTTEEETSQPKAVKKDTIIETSKTSPVIETVQETTSEGHLPSIEDTTTEVEADRVSSEALTEAIGDILSKPFVVDLPSVEHTTETTTEIEHPDEKPSVDSLTQIAEQIKSMISAPVTRTEKEVRETTDTKEELIPETTTLSTKETVQESTSEDRPSLVDHATKEIEAERLSTQALTEAMREILATPLTVHLPSVDSTSETTTTHTEQQLEKQTVEASSPHVEQVTTAVTSTETTTDEETSQSRAVKEDRIVEPSKPSSAMETVQETTSEDRQPSIEDTTREVEAERLSSEVLTEAVREILGTPLTVHLPSIEQTTETTTEIEHLDEKPSVDSLTQITEQIRSMISSPMTRKEEQIVQTTDTKEEIPESKTTLSTKETVQESTSEDRPSLVDDARKEVEAEHLSTEALTEAVREILSTPLTVHVASADLKMESIESNEQPSRDIITETTLQTPIIPGRATTMEEITTITQEPSSDVVKKTEVDKDITTDSLTETVRQILATPVTTHLPSVDFATEKTVKSTEEEVGTQSVETLSPHVEQVTTTITSTETTTDEETSESRAVKEDRIVEPSKPSSVMETVQETTSEDRQPSIEDTIREVEAERLSSEVLTEAVREILATPLTIHLPPVDSKSETAPTHERQAEPTLSTTPLETAEKIKVITDQPSTKTEEDLLKVTTTTTPVIEETITERKEPSDKVKEDKEKDETVSTDSLADTVRQILAVPGSVHLPSADETTQSKGLIEQEVEKPSSGILGRIVQQVKEVYNDLVSTSEESSIQTSTTEETKQETR